MKMILPLFQLTCITNVPRAKHVLKIAKWIPLLPSRDNYCISKYEVKSFAKHYQEKYCVRLQQRVTI